MGRLMGTQLALVVCLLAIVPEWIRGDENEIAGGPVPSGSAMATPVQSLPAPSEAYKKSSRHHPLRNWFQNNWCCWTHHDDLGCGSLKAEWAFIFGSCRTFYGEPCQKKPGKSFGGDY